MAAAKINLEYAVRISLFSAIMLGFGLWSLYDGAVKYPAQNREYGAAYDDLTARKLSPEPFAKELFRIMKERGWKAEHVLPGTRAPLHSESDIRTQFGMAVAFLPLGFAVFFLLVRNCRRRFSADDAGLHGFLPEAVPYSAIQSVNREKWESKGIVRLAVSVAAGRKTLTLDDWKFRGMEAILAEVDRNRPELAPPKPADASATEVAPPSDADKSAPPTE